MALKSNEILSSCKLQKRIDASAAGDVYGKRGAKFPTIIFDAKWTHPQAFNLSSCDFELSSTRCVQWPSHSMMCSQTTIYEFCLRWQIYSSETSVSAHQSTRCHNPGDYNLKTIRCFDILAVNIQAIRYGISQADYCLLLCCVSCRVETTWRHFDVSKNWCTLFCYQNAISLINRFTMVGIVWRCTYTAPARYLPCPLNACQLALSRVSPLEWKGRRRTQGMCWLACCRLGKYRNALLLCLVIASQ